MPRPAALAVAALVALTAGAPATAREELEILAQVGGTWHELAVEGAVGYALRAGRLVTLDLSDPAAPRVLGRSEPVLTHAFDVEVDESVAYVADGEGVLRFDVSDPARPRSLAPLEAPGALSVTSHDGWLYVIRRRQLEGTRGSERYLDAWRIAGPEAPRRLDSRRQVGVAVQAVAVGGRLVVAHVTTLEVLALDDPAAPRVVHELEVDVITAGHGLVPWGDRLLVVGQATDGVPSARVVSGLRDDRPVAGPLLRHPEGVGESSAALLRSAVVVGTTLLALRERVGVHASVPFGTASDLVLAELEPGDGEVPRWRPESVPLPGRVMALAGLEGTVLVAGTDGLLPLTRDAGGAFAPVAGTALDRPSPGVRAVAATEHRCWLLDEDEGVLACSTEADGAPRRIPLPGTALSLAARGAWAFVGSVNPGARHLSVVHADGDDVSVVSESALSIPLRPDRLELGEERLLIATARAGEPLLQVVDVRDPAAPVLREALTLPPGIASPVEDMAMVGDRAVLVVADRLLLIDLAGTTDGAPPRLLGDFDVPSPTTGVALDATGRYAYVAAGEAGLRVIDLRLPDLPDEVGSAQPPHGAADVVLHGGLAYVAGDDRGGLWAYDVADPARPRLVAHTLQPVAYVPKRSLAVGGDRIYVAAGAAGALVFGAVRRGEEVAIRVALPWVGWDTELRAP